VRFSPDGGTTWRLLVVDSAAASVSVPAEWLPGATQPVVEVQASDGLRVDTRVYALSAAAGR
jgi:hypothetical protein